MESIRPHLKQSALHNITPVIGGRPKSLADGGLCETFRTALAPLLLGELLSIVPTKVLS